MKPKIEPIFSYTEFAELVVEAEESISVRAAAIANAKIEKLLGPKLTGYFSSDVHPKMVTFSLKGSGYDTHSAYLFNIQPIETRPACEVNGEHEPIEWSRGANDTPSSTYEMKCKHCKQPIKAKWEVQK